MLEKTMTENLIECTIILFVAGLVVYGLSWAAQKETELGIHGKSSESLLSGYEQKKENK